jgi:hypothetical protein
MEEEAAQLFNRLTARSGCPDEHETSTTQAEMPTNTVQTGCCAARNKKKATPVPPQLSKGLSFA